MSKLNDPNAAPSLHRTGEARANGHPASLSDRVRSLRLPDRPIHQPARTAWLPWFLCLVLAGNSGYLGYRTYLTPAPAPTEEELTPVAPSTASASSAQPAALAGQRLQALESGGFIIPVQRVQVSPKVGGQVLRLYYQEGEQVHKGDLLAVLDPEKYLFNYDRMATAAAQYYADWLKLKNGNREEEKRQSEAALREAEASREQLRDELHRLRRAGTATPPEELVRTESRLRQAQFRARQMAEMFQIMMKGAREEEIAKAWHAYQNACAMRDDAEYDLNNTWVLAPVDGVILKKYAEEGNMVRPEAYSNGLSASLYDMADLTKLEVDVDVSERDIELVRKGLECEVRPEALPKKVYQGQVSRLMPEATRSKGSVSVRVRILDPDDVIRPEMRARVRFLASSEKPTRR